MITLLFLFIGLVVLVYVVAFIIGVALTDSSQEEHYRQAQEVYNSLTPEERDELRNKGF